MTDFEQFKSNRLHALKVYKKIKQIIKDKIKIPIKIYLAGSVAKKTSIYNNEIDIFIKSDNPELIYEEILKLNFNYISHVSITKYITFKYSDTYVDLVPVTNDLKNNSYYSFFHIAYVKKYLKHPEQVIKLKKWLILNSLYHTNCDYGISGYICELLIIKYINLNNLFNDSNLIKYLKNICDPCAPNRYLFKSMSNSVIERFKLYIDYNASLNFFQYLDYKILKFKKNSEIINKIKKIIDLLRKNNRFINNYIFEQHYYLIYYNSIELIKITEKFNNNMNLEQILKTRYISFDNNNKFTNLLVYINLNLLKKYSQPINSEDASIIHTYMNTHHYLKINKLKHVQF